jgi:hypothetical protein
VQLSFHRILKSSIRVNRSFGRSLVFLTELKQRFERHSGDNTIRINLIKILNLLYDYHTDPVRLIGDFGFADLLQRLSTDATFHLGVPLARSLLAKYHAVLHPLPGAAAVAAAAAAAALAAAAAHAAHTGGGPPASPPPANPYSLTASSPLLLSPSTPVGSRII